MRYALAIETSCDETSLAIVSVPEKSNYTGFVEYCNSAEIIAHIIASQAATFAVYGGVIPEISARQHADQLWDLWVVLLGQAMDKTGLPELDILSSIDTVYVTTEPGLVSALRVGQEFAKAVAYQIGQKTNKYPIVVPINHLKGHIISCFYTAQETPLDYDVFPHLHLLVSGGNTQLLLINSPTQQRIVGQTTDDAAGECLDKIGRMVGLDYPAGKTISDIVGTNQTNPISLPISMKGKSGYNFSYSGLKTAAKYHIQKQSGIPYEKKLTNQETTTLKDQTANLNPKLHTIKELLVATHTVVIEQLIMQLKKAIKHYQPKSIGISGGVSANKILREEVSHLHPNFFVTPLALTGDNAVMIALAGIASNY